MASDKRNAIVVIALIASMTSGVFVLRTFESLLSPTRVQYRSDIALTALTREQRRQVQVDVVCAPADAGNIDTAEAGESVVAVYPDGSQPVRQVFGPRVRLIVVEDQAGRKLGDPQKLALLSVLNAVVGDRSTEEAPVRLAPPEEQLAPSDEVRNFLVLKGFLRK